MKFERVINGETVEYEIKPRFKVGDVVLLTDKNGKNVDGKYGVVVAVNISQDNVSYDIIYYNNKNIEIRKDVIYPDDIDSEEKDSSLERMFRLLDWEENIAQNNMRFVDRSDIYNSAIRLMKRVENKRKKLKGLQEHYEKYYVDDRMEQIKTIVERMKK